MPVCVVKGTEPIEPSPRTEAGSKAQKQPHECLQLFPNQMSKNSCHGNDPGVPIGHVPLSSSKAIVLENILCDIRNTGEGDFHNAWQSSAPLWCNRGRSTKDTVDRSPVRFEKGTHQAGGLDLDLELKPWCLWVLGNLANQATSPVRSPAFFMILILNSQ